MIRTQNCMCLSMYVCVILFVGEWVEYLTISLYVLYIGLCGSII